MQWSDRQAEQTTWTGERIARGVAASKASVTGRVGHNLFSGLLRCSECRGNHSLLNNYTNGRICSSDRDVKRELPEELQLADIRKDLLSAEVLQEVECGI